MSEAWNLVLPRPATRWNVFVRDRVAERTILVSPSDVTETDCGRAGVAFPCRQGGWPIGRISGDGRFVAFTSRSMQLLPANLYHGDQVYLFDVDGRRLRRISVEPSGWESDSCSVEPVLSADAKVLAYRSTATNLVAGDANGLADVFAHDWTCDDAGRCRTLAACPAEPVRVRGGDRLAAAPRRSARRAASSRISCSGAGAATPRRRRSPIRSSGARYQLCVYAGSLSLDLAAPAAPACGGGTRPCWQALGTGYKLIDARGGLSNLRRERSGGTPHVLVRGNGPLLDAPYLPLKAADGLVVQLQETGTGRCWGADMPASAIRYNVSGPAQRGTGRNGKLVAQVR